MRKRAHVDDAGNVRCWNCGGLNFMIRSSKQTKKRQRLRCVECDERQWFPAGLLEFFDARLTSKAGPTPSPPRTTNDRKRRRNVSRAAARGSRSSPESVQFSRHRRSNSS